MEEVLHYLELKNQYYEKFYHVTVKFLDQVSQEKWADIDIFVDNRDRILNIINSYDHKIALRVREMKLNDDETKQYKAQVKELIATRQVVADKIFAADLELIGRIDEVKSETIKELKQSLETANQINAFTQSEKRASKLPKEA